MGTVTGYAAGIVTCWVLRKRIVQSSPGELPSYLAPSATQRSMSRDFFLG